MPMTGLLTIDPNLFLDSAISEETAAAVRKIEEESSHMPSLRDIPIEAIRARLSDGAGILGREPLSDKARWREITGSGRTIALREIVPDTVEGVYLHIHGGGYCMGGADYQDQSLTALARATNCAVFSVEYRLTPENPWPAGIEDCEAAALWLAEGVGTEFGTDRLFIGGESAGAHYAASTLIRMRDDHGFSGFAGANLVSGPYDMTMTPGLRNWGNRALVLDTDVCAYFGTQLYPPADWTMEDRRRPDVSPLFARLDGMPPALFTTGTLDPVLDDSLFMAQRWLAAGCEVDLAIYPGGFHAFEKLDIGISRQARQKMYDFISARIK